MLWIVNLNKFGTKSGDFAQRGLIKVASPKFGKSINHVTTFWNSKFSDGTPLGLITSNYGKDPVRNIIVNDHLNLLFIK